MAPPRLRRYNRPVDIDGTWLLIVVGLTALCLLLTGPGMWSEKWGWGWFSRGEKLEEGGETAAPPAGGDRSDRGEP